MVFYRPSVLVNHKASSPPQKKEKNKTTLLKSEPPTDQSNKTIPLPPQKGCRKDAKTPVQSRCQWSKFKRTLSCTLTEEWSDHR